jgi:O-antigen/teichoic acid export membrane protein
VTSLRVRLSELRLHLREPLYRNAYALMANTAITSLLGMLAVIIAARIYPPDVVGYNQALVAGMQLLSAVTQLNFASVLMRFLPKAGPASKVLLLAAYGISTATAIGVTAIVLGGAELFASADHVLNMSAGLAIVFILAVAGYSIFNLQDAALTGLRRTTWVPVENGIHGIARIVVLIAGGGVFGSLAIFASWILPIALILLPLNWFIFRRFLRTHMASTEVEPQPIERGKIVRFIAGDYPGSLFVQATTTFLPLLVISVLGATANGYFSVPQTIAIATDLIVINLAQSLLVEASRDETKIAQYTKDVLKQMIRLVVPLVAVIIIAAPYILSLLDSDIADYSGQSTTLLQLLVVASLPRIITAIYGSLARLEHKTHKIAVSTAVQALILIGGSLILMPSMGIDAVGVSAIASQLVVAIAVLPGIWRTLRYDPNKPEVIN